MFNEQQKLRSIASCFGRDQILGYITDSLGYITREEVERLAQQLYSDSLAGQARPVGTVLQETGLTRESEKLRYLRSFLGRLDQTFVNTLRSTYGHDILMSAVALQYDRSEMEEKLDFTPWQPGKPMRSPSYWLAGEGPIRPLMMDFFQLESQRLVGIQENNGQEVVRPTYGMDSRADSLEAIIRSPLISNGNILLVAGKSEIRIATRV